MKSLGIYVHIPFCIKKCFYCDFCSFPDSLCDMSAYTDELCRRIIEAHDVCREYVVDTVYFGGGTPTLLQISDFAKIFSALRDSFNIDTGAEITCECNPATADMEYFRELRELGVNRLSIGLQSANDNELRALGRAHSFEDFLKVFSDARAAGFDNISVDLMYAIPEQTLQSFEYSIDRVIELSPEHISSYGLKIEENTPFAKCRDRLILPDEDEEFLMYKLLGDKLLENGYNKYEISNFARDGYESRHNIRYWRCHEYLGFGVAAHSYFGGERYGNSRDIKGFVAGKDISEDRQTISSRDRDIEYVMLGLRLAEGVDESKLSSIIKNKYPYIRQMIKNGFMQEKDGRISFTDKGFFVSNHILSEILDM